MTESNKMVKITFEYIDEYTHGKWNKQTCIVNDIEECIKIYGLDSPYCIYRIVSAEEVWITELQKLDDENIEEEVFANSYIKGLHDGYKIGKKYKEGEDEG